MSFDIDDLRADYRKVRSWWSQYGGWDAADISEADSAVASAVQKGDTDLLACWKNYFREIIQQIPANQMTTNRREQQ